MYQRKAYPRCRVLKIQLLTTPMQIDGIAYYSILSASLLIHELSSLLIV
uniref:Uncharacterized protein n=1 Tax=Arundo donax TaxID=35708 RepID=A0A0A9C1B0_ARUDO